MRNPIDPATKKRAEEIQARIREGWSFQIDWPPMFEPQPWQPAFVMSEVQLENMRKGREAANARVRARKSAGAIRWNGAPV